MSAAVERIQELMRTLKLVRTAEELPLLLQEASKHESSYSDFLEDLVSREIAAKHERHAAMKTRRLTSPACVGLERTFPIAFTRVVVWDSVPA